MRLRYRRRSTPRLHRRWHRGGPPPHRGVQPPQTKALTLALTPTVPAVFTGWILLAGQRLALKAVADGIWLVRFMHYALGYIDLEHSALQPLDNPLGSGLPPISSVRFFTSFSGSALVYFPHHT